MGGLRFVFSSQHNSSLHLRMLVVVMITGVFCLLAQTSVSAEVKTITATGEYTMGEAETPLVAKERAAVQAMRAASEQAGVYLESLSEVKNMQLTKDEIMVLTSAVLKVIEKRYADPMHVGGGFRYICTITADVDSSQMEKMKERARDKQANDTLKKVQEDYAKAQIEIEELKQKLAAAKSETERKLFKAAMIKNEDLFTAAQWFQRGYEFADNRKDYDSAIQAFTKAIILDPLYANAYNCRGVAYERKGQLDQAIADFNHAITLNPRHALAYNNRGVVYERKGQRDKAFSDYNHAIMLDPREALAYYNRGSAYAGKELLDLAIADYDKAIKIDPREANTYINRGIAYGMKEQLDLAIADFFQAITLNPQLERAYYNRGYAYYLKGQLDHAIADFDKAIALSPDFANPYYFRALACEKAARFNEAIAAYEGYLRHAPSEQTELIKYARQRIAALRG